MYCKYGKPLKGYLSLDGAASQLGVTRQGVFKMIKAGDIMPEYVGRVYLVPQAELDRLVKNRHSQNITDGRYKVK